MNHSKSRFSFKMFSSLSVLFAAVILTAASFASAEVILDFESGNIAPFVSDSNQGGASVSWASIDMDGDGNGDNGALCVTSTGGFSGNAAKFELFNTPALTELQSAVDNGGTISMDVIVFADDITLTSNPGWFESTFIIQTGLNIGTNVYDDNKEVISRPTTPGSMSFETVEFTVLPNGSFANDDNANTLAGMFDYANFWVGPNNEDAAVDGVTMYFDNITISAVPEPQSMSLLGLLTMALIGVRSRRS